jgi:hypothetical protein
MPQMLLPMFPAESTELSSTISFAARDGMVTYFHGCMPVFRHAVDDVASFRMFTSQLHLNDQCKQMDIVRAFGVPKVTVLRAVEQLRTRGSASFFARRRVERKPRVLTPEVLGKVQALIDAGVAPADAAREADLKPNTVNKALHAGRLREKKRTPFPP